MPARSIFSLGFSENRKLRVGGWLLLLKKTGFDSGREKLCVQGVKVAGKSSLRLTLLHT